MTLTLTEALERATKGPVTAVTDRATVYIDLGPGMPAFGCTGWVKEVVEPEAALLAHCRNELGPLVEAAQELAEEYTDGKCYPHERDMWANLRAALQRAQTVKMI